MTKDEKVLFESLKKEMRGMNNRIERLTRQIEIQNVLIVTKDASVEDLKDGEGLSKNFEILLQLNDIFECALKKLAIEAFKAKIKEKEEVIEDEV